MVQLIDCHDCSSSQKPCYFNSTMVQLIVFENSSSNFSRKTFQFYYGSINSPDGILLVLFVGYFNSTMVQLIGNIHARKKACYRIFQFYYGSINRS